MDFWPKLFRYRAIFCDTYALHPWARRFVTRAAWTKIEDQRHIGFRFDHEAIEPAIVIEQCTRLPVDTAIDARVQSQTDFATDNRQASRLRGNHLWADGSIAARIAMITVTMRSSIRVNARCEVRDARYSVSWLKHGALEPHSSCCCFRTFVRSPSYGFYIHRL